MNPATLTAIASIGIEVYSYFEDDNDTPVDRSEQILGELEQIKAHLESIEFKIDTAIRQNSQILKAVLELRSSIPRMLRDNELNEAYSAFRHARDYIRFAPTLNPGIVEPMQERIQAEWRLILDYETNLDQILRLPYRAEILLVLSKNELRDLIKSGISSKIKEIDDWLTHQKKQAEQFIGWLNALTSRDAIDSYDWLEAEPWFVWRMKAANRTNQYSRPDIGWKNEVSIVNNAAQAYTGDLNKHLQALRAGTSVKMALESYVNGI